MQYHVREVLVNNSTLVLILDRGESEFEPVKASDDIEIGVVGASGQGAAGK